MSLLGRIYRRMRDPEALLFRYAVRRQLTGLLRVLVSDPVTFNQHLRHRMVFDRRQLLVTLTDKIAAKDYIEGILGSGFTPATLAVADSAEDIDADSLPDEYAAKVNHTSGGVILVSDSFSRTDTLPVPPTGLSRLKFRSTEVSFAELGPVLNYWLSLRYGGNKGEWAYTQITPRILVEEYLKNDSDSPPPDYKFFVFGGKVHAVRMDLYVDSVKYRHHYDADGDFIPVSFAEFGQPLFPERMPAPSLPSRFKEMVEIAETLGETLDFARVDLYEVNGRIYVGELTMYPTNGTAYYRPKRFDYWLGSAWPKSRD